MDWREDWRGVTAAVARDVNARKAVVRIVDFMIQKICA